MNKPQKVYICSNCGAESLRWIGRCNSCGEWNTYKEEIKESSKVLNGLKGEAELSYKSILLSNIKANSNLRIDTTDTEFNKVLGGGIVPGSLILLGGEPGIGKSTLLLQVMLQMNQRILYISGEESAEQIKMRADRLGKISDNLYLLCATDINIIINQIKDLKPNLIIVDSIQTLVSNQQQAMPGTITQIRECSIMLQSVAKSYSLPIILVGHITKDGIIAGPKVLEHIVDVVLLFEGDKHYMYRILRTIKNRFGSTSEIGIYEMLNSGLKKVKNPSGIMLSDTSSLLSGMCICAALEGNQAFLIEVQALVSSAVYGVPQRVSTGYESKRLNMLLAVLEKRIGFQLGKKDVFLNIVGGLKVVDTAIDLSVIIAILSSNLDKPINKNIVIIGEVGLNGEIRAISRVESRISEALKLGFDKIILPYANYKLIDSSKRDNLIPVKTVMQALKCVFS